MFDVALDNTEISTCGHARAGKFAFRLTDLQQHRKLVLAAETETASLSWAESILEHGASGLFRSLSVRSHRRVGTDRMTWTLPGRPAHTDSCLSTLVVRSSPSRPCRSCRSVARSQLAQEQCRRTVPRTTRPGAARSISSPLDLGGCHEMQAWGARHKCRRGLLQSRGRQKPSHSRTVAEGVASRSWRSKTRPQRG